MIYRITLPVTLPECADIAYHNLSLSEVRRGDCRTIGGDRADVEFRGYTLDYDAKTTTLHDVSLVGAVECLTDTEARDLAQSIVDRSYESIGIETVEHS